MGKKKKSTPSDGDADDVSHHEVRGRGKGDRFDPGYRTGYKHPPIATRFQKGKSGNPRGRPRGTPNLRSRIRKRLMAPVQLIENGKQQRVPLIEALVFLVGRDALRGRLKPLIEVCKFLDSASIFSMTELAEPPGNNIYNSKVTVRLVRPGPRGPDSESA